MHLPSSVRVEYGGTYQEQQKVLRRARPRAHSGARARLRRAAHRVPQLRRAHRDPHIVGAVDRAASSVRFCITGITFNVASFMGLIMVIGIVAKNGILLLDADERYRTEGH